jgi:hypothetical protein
VTLEQVILQTLQLSPVRIVSPLIHNHLRLQSYPQQEVKRLKPGGLRTKAMFLFSQRTNSFSISFPNFLATEENTVWKNYFLLIE